MTYTTNYTMNKPAGSDPAAIGPLNENFEIIDGVMKQNEDNITEIQGAVIDEIDKTTSSVSGSVITITDSAPNSIAKSLVASIVAQQASGTPSPSNPLPISGFTGVTVTVEDDYDNPTEVKTTTLSWQTESGTVYGGYINPISGELTVTHKGVDLGDLSWTYNSTGQYFVASISGSGTSSNRIYLCSTYVFNYWSSAASGLINATDKQGYFQQNNTNIFIKNSDYTDADAFKTAITGQTLVYELATPLTYQFTPTAIKLLENNNTVFSDTGDTALTYVVSDKYSKSGIPTVEAVKSYVTEAIGDISDILAEVIGE